MDFIIKIDQFIIEFFEKISHKFQDWTGKNNFWTTRCLLLIYFAFMVFCEKFLIESQDFLSEEKHFPMTRLILPFLIVVWFLITTFKLESIILNTAKFRNFLAQPSILGAFLRTTYIFYVLGKFLRLFLIDLSHEHFLSSTCEFIASAALMICFYLTCVTPKPPGQSKIKKLLKSLFRRRGVATVPS